MNNWTANRQHTACGENQKYLSEYNQNVLIEKQSCKRHDDCKRNTVFFGYEMQKIIFRDAEKLMEFQKF